MKRKPVYYIQDPQYDEHTHVPVYNPWVRQTIPIDQRLAKLIALLWALNVQTEACCQGSFLVDKYGYESYKSEWAYIKFFELEHAWTFANMLRLKKFHFKFENDFNDGTACVRFKKRAIPAIVNFHLGLAKWMRVKVNG